ncbi:MAG: 3-phosphoshikimate 1-carboxyvinyltransferase [Chloroflexi bacterium]|nr:3-phosphoshikimate 1-carboxyvinyltransferase [Chloroflexota bacterium]
MPASKSVANRELVLSAIAGGRSRLELGPLDPGDDVRAMRQAISALGYGVEWDQLGHVTVSGQGSGAPTASATVNAGEAGTVARFVTALAALGSGRVTIDGSPRLRERPIAPLLAALRSLGATVDADALPVTVSGPLRGGAVDVPGGQSSQFASALLLVGARAQDGITVRITGPLVSAPFVALTISALKARGVSVKLGAPNTYAIKPQKVKARSLVIPGDATAATYPAAAAAILGGEVTIENIEARPRAGGQGDVRFFELIERMGCTVSHGSGVTVKRRGPLYGINADVQDCSDVFPTLSVIAAFAEDPTELAGIAHTRGQESDRVEAVAAGLRAIGCGATAYADAIRIEPRPLRGGTIDAHGDHRIAMAFSVAGLQVPGVAIEGADSVTKTFPEFYGMLKELSR